MKTIEQIEKRRRELSYIAYFIIYFLSLVVFGLFFFIDQFAGFFGTLKYNVFLRTYFVSFIIAFIFYMVQKEKQQAGLTREVLEEMERTAENLKRQNAQKQFLTEISYLVAGARDDAVLQKLFNVTLKFLKADGGAVILKHEDGGWNSPLAVYPVDGEAPIADQMTRLVATAGRSLLQPDPAFPEHRHIRETRTAVGVPLRLEGRLYGIISFWSDNGFDYDESHLAVVEFMAREAANSAFGAELLHQKNAQFHGLVDLLAKIADRKTKNKTSMVAHQAKVLAEQMGLDGDSVNDVLMAAVLRDVGRIMVNGNGGRGAGDTVETLRLLKFPKRVTEIVAGYAAANGERKKIPTGSKILLVAEAYISAASPKRGREVTAAGALEKLEKHAGTRYDADVLSALKQLISRGQENLSGSNEVGVPAPQENPGLVT